MSETNDNILTTSGLQAIDPDGFGIPQNYRLDEIVAEAKRNQP